MKITKQRLKEIIREELSTVRESDWYDDEHETLADKKFSDRNAGLGDIQTEPHREGGTPEERLLNKLLIVSKVGSAPDGGAAAEILGLGGDEEVVAYLDDLLGNQMYRESGMEEVVQSGGKPSKPEAEHSEVSYNPRKSTRKAFHKKSRQDAKQAIKKGVN